MKKIALIIFLFSAAATTIISCKKDNTTNGAGACTFSYSAWSTCSNNVQTRTFTSSPSGCTGTPPADSLSRSCSTNCPTITFTATKVDVLPCPSTNGSITISASGGATPYTYSKDGGSTFQSSNIFSNLTASNYSITVKDVNGCTSSAQSFTVGTQAPGTYFTQVKSIVSSYCRSCHGSSGGCDLSTDCNIVSYASRINVRCVTQATSNPMPPSGALNSTLRGQITNWINAGGRYTD